MRLLRIEPIAVAVELSLADCLCLYNALTREADRRDECDQPLCDALASALLGHAFADFLACNPDPPRTFAHLWEAWAPHDTFHDRPRRLPAPAALTVAQIKEDPR